MFCDDLDPRFALPEECGAGRVARIVKDGEIARID